MRGSLLFTVAVLLVAEALFIYFMRTSYYDDVAREVQAQLTGIGYQLEPASASTMVETRSTLLRTLVEEYEDKASFELTLIDRNGYVVSSSSGIVPRRTQPAEDILSVLYPESGYSGRFVGPNENGERVMAMTAATPFIADGVAAVRVVTSLTGVDTAVRNLILLSIILILVVIVASLISGVYFIRSIVLPVQNVEATAKRIAAGDLDTRIEIKSNDEIGKLCKTINDMAEELSHTERMKNDFISSVSHELRTPLTSIKGWIETVGSIQDPADPNLRRGVEIIAGEADRLYSMVEELLDFSRMQNGIQLTTELLDLAAEVEEAVLLQCQRAGSLGLSIEYEAPELPVPVMADKNRVRQVLINILDNAIKYSPEGNSIGVEILMGPADAFVVIEDAGQGISPEDLENVKLRFYKGKGAVRGSGIGLAVVDEIMAAHEGSLELTSEPGRGTEVTLRFPLYSKKAPATGV